MTNGCSFQVPTGVRDLLPIEVRTRRQLENRLLAFFESWGYQEISTPTFEFVETFENGSQVRGNDCLYKFIDRCGRVLALRPEMTASIARLTATKLRSYPLPLRLCYSANVFRYEELQINHQREFKQVGVELVGAAGVAADAEIIALAVETLLKAGLEDFRLGLGQVAVTKGVLRDLGLSPQETAAIEIILTSKDLVALERLAVEYGLDGKQRSHLQLLAELHGGGEAIEKAQEHFAYTEAATSLEELAEVWQILKAYGLQKWLFIDLGILRDFNYYTGIVFEGYVNGLGVPICGGGRYDGLLAQFGYSCPATGFALGLERLLTVPGNNELINSIPEQGYLAAGQELSAVLARAQQMRRQGGMVVLGGACQDRRQAEKKAVAEGLTLVWVEGGDTGEK